MWFDEDGFTDPKEGAQAVACKRLWAEVLHLAIKDAAVDLMTARSRTKSEYSTEAYRWVMDDTPRKFGFVWVCEMLALHPEKVRSALTSNARSLAVEGMRELRKRGAK